MVSRRRGLSPFILNHRARRFRRCIASVVLLFLTVQIAIPSGAAAQSLGAELLKRAEEKPAASSSGANAASALSQLSPDQVTSATNALAGDYAAARIRYLKDVQRIQNKEIAALQKVATAEKEKAAAAKRAVQVAHGKGFWDQVLEGKNLFVSIWHWEIVTISGEPVTIGKIILGLAVLIFGLMQAGRVTKVVRRRIIDRFRIDENAMVAFEKVFFYCFVIFIILFSLQLVSIPLSLFAFLGGAVALAFGFGAQNILNNFISGWILMAERPIRIGDLIELEGDYGSVESIGARCTRIRLFTGIHILVPNSALLEKNVINWTLSDDKVRVYVAVGIAYGSPTRKAEELIRQAVDEHTKILKDPPPVILFEDFGDNSLAFEVHFWVTVRRLMDARKIKSEVRFRIDDLFREAGIVIAFPQRDVHLDTLSPLRVQVLGDEEHARKALEEENAKVERKKAQEQEEAERREHDTRSTSSGDAPEQRFEPGGEDSKDEEDNTGNEPGGDGGGGTGGT